MGRRPNAGRVAAVKALMWVEEGKFAEEGLNAHAPGRPDDRALAWFLTLGVLRNRSHVDASLRAHLRQPIGALDASIRATLRMGAFEKLYARTPSHAVVNEAVEVCKAVGKGHARGLVNAVLRRAAAPERLSDAQRHNHPAWLWERWVERYGEDGAAAWAERNQQTPPLVIVSPNEAFDGACLAGDGVECVPAQIQGRPIRGAFLVQGHKGGVEPLLNQPGAPCWVQDPGAIAVADFVGAGQGTRVLDACAAPGGKTFRMAAQGADVLAVDRSPERLTMVTEGVARLGLSASTRAHDWLSGPWEGPSEFDIVLVDAPCTGLGTVGRHPEIRWLRNPGDLERCAERQQAILEAASALVRPGGTLVYAVCSGEPEEGGGVTATFSSRNPGFELLETWTSAPPQDYEDAHFAAKWRRGT